MRSFLIACVAAVVVALGAAAVLDLGVQRSSEQTFASPTGVRI